MRSLYLLSSPLRRECRFQPVRIFSRFINGFDSSRPVPTRTVAGKPTLLPTQPARTRFAPSPTGYLHLGSLRTALYNYLLARATGGQFLLRLEDTDQARIVGDAESRLYDDLRWAGLSWDEGPDVGGKFGPYTQSKRLDIYGEHADKLLAGDQAYRCFCTPEELDQMKSQAIKEGTPTQYNRKCSHIPRLEATQRAANGESHCIRFKSELVPLVRDLVYGTYKLPQAEDDFILIKRDGFPTYHFANVIDDHLMQITHVIRGAEWLVSTPRHVMLYNAFGWDPPRFAHVGLLTDEEGQKLSKRNGNIDISSFRDDHILPAALLNYAILLGWSPSRHLPTTSEVLDLQEMIDQFHLRFTKGNIKINKKLNHFHLKHMRKMMPYMTPQKIKTQIYPALRELIRKYDDIRTNPEDKVEHEASLFGPLVPLARPAEGVSEPADMDYVMKIFSMEQDLYSYPDNWIRRCKYLLWQVTPAMYESTLGPELQMVEKFYTKTPIPDVAPATEPSEQAEEPNNDAFETKDRTPAELIGLFEQSLSPIPEAEWNADVLLSTFRPLSKAICSEPQQGKEVKKLDWGYHLLRWILFAMHAGPRLIFSMEILGKEETLRRMAEARKVAEVLWEKEMAGREERQSGN